jgi:integrase/recombinase XerD
MASVYKRGNTWWVRFQWNGQEVRRSARTAVKSEARAYLADLQAQFRSLTLTGKERATFATAAVAYVEGHVSRKKVSTIASYMQSLRVLTEEFGQLYLDQITRSRIAAFEAKQLKRVSASKVKHYRAALSGLFLTAIQREWADSNPCRDLGPIEVRNARHRYLTPQEWRKLEAALPASLAAVATVAIKRGMRLGEILALEWPDLDFHRQTIAIRDSKGNRPRLLPMEDAEDLLAALPRKGRYVFPSSTGTRQRVDSVSKAVNAAARQAGVADFTFHDLRHTFASWYVQRGGDLYRLQLILGHKGPTMTQRYAHLRVDDLREGTQMSAQRSRDFLH